MRYTRAGITALVGLALAAPADGQGSRGCAGYIGSVGIERLRGSSFGFHRLGDGWAWTFGTEPTVTRVEDHGQSGDLLREGDVLVAVDGVLITTDEGGRRLGALEPGESARITVRREGRQQDLRIQAGRQCVPAAPPAPAPPPARPAPGAAPAPLPPPARRAPVPAPPRPAPPPPAPSDAYLGFSFQCSDCGMRRARGGERYTWFFSEPPLVTAVDDEGPGRGRLRAGDRLVALNGVALTDAEGGRLLGAVEPGDRLSWTVERGGRAVVTEMVAAEPRTPSPTPAAAPAAPAPPAGPQSPLRYTGRLGDTLIEARGGRLNVTVDEGTGEIIIRSGDVWVRLRSVEAGRDP